MRVAARLAAIAMMFPLGGCFSLGYSRANVDEPLLDATLQALRPGRDSLATCLASLGAPDRVFEYQGDGMVLLWVRKDVAGWAFELSSPWEDVPGSLSLELESADLPGCALWFRPDLVLLRWRFGAIGDLLRGRVRPGSPREG